MSNVIVTVVESTTDVTVTEPTVLVDVTENSVEVLSSTAGIQGAKGNDGGLGFYGAFSDYTDQFAGGGTSYANSTANVAYPMRFTTTDESHGVSVVDGDGFQSRITFAYSGVYNLQWSGQFENIDNALHDVSVWLRKGGVDNVVGSNGLVGVPARKSANEPAHIIAGWNFVFSVMAGDYYEFMWSSNSTNVSIQTYPVSTVPTRPSTASLVLTVTQVMNNALPSGTLAVVSPITNTGTSANAVVGLDQTALSITQSQVSGLVSALAGKANLAGGNAFTEAQSITNTVIGAVPLLVKGASGQSASFFEVLANAGNTLFRVNATGYGMTPLGFIGGGTTMATNARNTFYTAAAASIGLVIQGASGQTADLLQAQDSTGAKKTYIAANGDMSTGSLGLGYAAPYSGVSNSILGILTVGAGNKGITVRGAASQTANLQEWQNSAGTILANVASDGLIRGSANIIAQGVVGTTGGAAGNTAIARLQANSAGLDGGWLQLRRVTSAVGNPGASIGNIYFRDGTTAGTLKLVVRAGAAGAETTILDNIPQ